MPIDLKTLEKLLVLAKKHKLAELEVEDGKSKFRIKTALGAAAQAIHLPMPQIPASGALSEAPSLTDSVKRISGAAAHVQDDKQMKVLSPFVGTFYRAPSPEAESYVKEGSTVKKGDVLCIVEAMKLMNEIESEVNGKIVAVLAENGQPVEYGEPLFLVEPL